VENNPGRSSRPARTGLGPAPAPSRGAERLSESRAALLETLRAQHEPTTIGALADATGLHANTVREHLDALLELGLATRFAAEPSGRGRPALLYEATDVVPGGGEYAGLAAALARTIHERSTTPVEDALAAGRSWGQDLAQGRGAVPQPNATTARRKVVELLDHMGFEPRTDAAARSVRLTRCPLLEAAHQYPDVVCGVHLGLARGALEQYGADPAGAELLPFVEPGACRLHLARKRS
jgi:predicted ArsR family transcriptional regulator